MRYKRTSRHNIFLFAGFLPPKSGPRRKRLEELAGVPATLVFFETGPRLEKSLADMADMLGPRQAALAKELTKLHETVTRGTLLTLAEGADLRGEFVVVVGPPPAAEIEVDDAEIVAALTQALSQESFRDAVRSVAEALHVGRGRVYELGLALEGKR